MVLFFQQHLLIIRLFIQNQAWAEQNPEDWWNATPNIKKGDLLVVSSSSGETVIPVNISKLAKKYGAKVAIVTANLKSTLGKIGNFSVWIPCPIKPHLLVEEDCSIQPMHNLFEQCLLLFFDCVSMMLQKRLGITEKQLWEVHANLE